MRKIYFVRHCSAFGQHKDSPLTNDGIMQAQLLADFFEEQNITFDQIVSSPYLRAVESIKPFAERAGIDIEVDNRLEERILSDEPIEDWLEELECSFNDYHYALPGGESANEVINRANEVLKPILNGHSVTNAIIVSHGNLLALVFSQFDKSFGFNQWKELGNPDIYLLESNDVDIISFKRIWDSK
ncbi:histidine phosphatase family protein [Oceanobacillus chungangensis]|uniref:Histidine phosphatase family protein n=1 Tax=Oceanobacillus chungangensis TaxID=1229152 RepID=A0A3D8Q349_9BACI|nr:histidine phosphatase family protein [Oceanobacillus chungangensis]RDW22089.1 histidine phosphatase family protein [Oceanobacillus chungangensis]